MSSYWVNFITKGDPNGPGLPNWPQYRDDNSKVQVLGDTVQTESTSSAFLARSFALKFYSAAYPRMLRP